MAEPRLKTELWIKACIWRANLHGQPVVVVARGDATSGAVLVKLNQLGQGFMVLAETRDSMGARAWFRGTGATPVEETVADAYISRNRKRDPDLWVLEVETRDGSLPFEGAVVGD